VCKWHWSAKITSPVPATSSPPLSPHNSRQTELSPRRRRNRAAAFGSDVGRETSSSPVAA
jgi:hypothetical protein